MTSSENETIEAKEQLVKAERRQAPEKKFILLYENTADDVKGANKSRKKVKTQRAEDNNRLRKLMVHWALRFVGWQIVICDLVIAGYVITELCKNHPIAPPGHHGMAQHQLGGSHRHLMGHRPKSVPVP